MKLFLGILFSAVGIVGFSVVTHAAVPQLKKYEYVLPAPQAIEIPEPTEGQMESELQAARARGKRTIAQSDSITPQTAFSADFLNLEDELVGGEKYDKNKAVIGNYPGIKTPEELDAYLSKVDADAFYATQAPDAKIAIAQLATLRVWRSFFNRSMRLTGSANISHTTIVTALRAVASGVGVYLPTDQWKVGIKYVSMPVDGAEPAYKGYSCHHDRPEGTKIKLFHGQTVSLDIQKRRTAIPNFCSDIITDGDFHDFLIFELIPTITRASNRIYALNFSDAPVYWDNRFIYGTANFGDDHDRIMAVGEAERHALQSGYFASLSGLLTLTAYNLDGFFGVLDQVGKLYGIGASFLPDGASAKQRTAIIRNMNKNTGFLTLNKGGEQYTKQAYVLAKLAVGEARKSWEQLNSSKGATGSRAILEPGVFTPYNRSIGLSFNNVQSLLSEKGHQAIKSAVINGETVDVNVPLLYENPPQNLCDFLPTGFDESGFKTTIPFHGIDREVHNYYNGTPTAWNMGAYQTYFPGLQSGGVPRAARILSQTWGGFIVGFPLAGVVF